MPKKLSSIFMEGLKENVADRLQNTMNKEILKDTDWALGMTSNEDWDGTIQIRDARKVIGKDDNTFAYEACAKCGFCDSS